MVENDQLSEALRLLMSKTTLAHHAIRKLCILAVARWLPKPDTTSGDRRFNAILGFLTKQHRVDLYYHYWNESSAVANRYHAMLNDFGIRILSGNSWRAFDRGLHRQCYDLVLFEFWEAAEQFTNSVRRHQPWAKLVVDTVDVHFLREEAALKLGHLDQDTVASHKRRELDAYQRADALIVVTREDQAALEICHDLPGLHFIPNIVPLCTRTARPRDQELLFVGGFGHAPNIDGLLWFVRAVWPAIQSECPDVHLTVVGSNPPQAIQELARLAGITMVGYVPDTAPYLDSAAISIAPLRYGAGMKGKVCEAMASGLPVVTTSIGAQGFAANSGEHLIVADSASEFAQSVVSLLRCPQRAEAIGRAGQRLIETICSPAVVANRLDAFLSEIHVGVLPCRPSFRWWLTSLYLHIGFLILLPFRLPGLSWVKSFLKACFGRK